MPSIGSPSELTTRPSRPLADRDFQDASGASGRVALADVAVVAEHHRADRIAFQVERDGVTVAGQRDHFAGHHVAEAVDAHDAVGHHDHGAFAGRLRRDIEFGDSLFDQV